MYILKIISMDVTTDPSYDFVFSLIDCNTNKYVFVVLAVFINYLNHVISF